VLRTAFYFIPSAMTGFIVCVFPFRNRVSSKEAFEGLELGEGKPSRPVLRGPGGRKAAWLLGNWKSRRQLFCSPSLRQSDTSTSRRKEVGYFFNSAGQFCTSVTGSVPSFRLPLLMRNFLPSAVTS
jgi:hypothetical protein